MGEREQNQKDISDSSSLTQQIEEIKTNLIIRIHMKKMEAPKSPELAAHKDDCDQTKINSSPKSSNVPMEGGKSTNMDSISGYKLINNKNNTSVTSSTDDSLNDSNNNGSSPSGSTTHSGNSDSYHAPDSQSPANDKNGNKISTEDDLDIQFGSLSLELKR